MKRIILALAILSSGVALANDVDPNGFEKEHFQFSKSREEVKADLKVAQANGELPRFGELGVQFRDPPSTKSRAQVAAETREAGRLGLLSQYGEGPHRSATPEEERLIRLAGERAVQQMQANK